MSVEWAYSILYPLNRWLHLTSMTLIVGGTLFYELVVPIAIEDLKHEQQLYIFARARWVFRWVVWLGVSLLLVTGLIGLHQMWHSYTTTYPDTQRWIAAHVTLAGISMIMAMVLTVGRRPLDQPVRWMRVNLVMFLVVISLASLTRHIRLTIRAATEGVTTITVVTPPAAIPSDPTPATRP